MLKLIDINKTYENKKVSTQALKNINLEIDDKGLISIVGVSGCGKTTLLNLIGGLDTDYQGSVLACFRGIEGLLTDGYLHHGQD